MHWNTLHLLCQTSLLDCFPPSFISGDTKCERYTDLLVPERWEYLVELFYAELFKLQSLPPVSLLSVHLQVQSSRSRYLEPAICVILSNRYFKIDYLKMLSYSVYRRRILLCIHVHHQALMLYSELQEL